VASGKAPNRRPGAVDPAVARAPVTAGDRVAAKAAKLSAKAAKHAEVADHLSRAAEHVAAHARRLDERAVGEFRTALGVWLRSDARTRKPRFTRDDIATEALRIVDSEGLDALSMRRLASEMDAGTMTLYHYVRTKDELLALLTDAIMGEVALPPGQRLPADWRASMTTIARRTKAALDRHPWVLDLRDDPAFGPNSVRHFDQSLEAASKFGGALEDQLDLLFAVDEYVFGFCLQFRTNVSAEPADVVDRHMVDHLDRLLAKGDLPQLQRLVDRHGLEGAWRAVSTSARDDGRFERNLQRLLDGFEARRRRR
jgi:AcrR family transcriptional regulator